MKAEFASRPSGVHVELDPPHEALAVFLAGDVGQRRESITEIRDWLAKSHSAPAGATKDIRVGDGYVLERGETHIHLSPVLDFLPSGDCTPAELGSVLEQLDVWLESHPR